MYMKKYWKEFREFAVKGNVIDLAVAVIIGGAFGKIVSSLVADVVMPLIGLIIGGLDFTSWQWILKPEILAEDGGVVKAAITMNIGKFIQNIFDFLIIALSIFLMIKVLTNVKKKLIKEEEKQEEKKEEKKEEPKPTEEQKLLTEIRDILKARQ